MALIEIDALPIKKNGWIFPWLLLLVIHHPMLPLSAGSTVQVHATAKWMLGFIGYYGLAAAPPITAIVVWLGA